MHGLGNMSEFRNEVCSCADRMKRSGRLEQLCMLKKELGCIEERLGYQKRNVNIPKDRSTEVFSSSRPLNYFQVNCVIALLQSEGSF